MLDWLNWLYSIVLENFETMRDGAIEQLGGYLFLILPASITSIVLVRICRQNSWGFSRYKGEYRGFRMSKGQRLENLLLEPECKVGRDWRFRPYLDWLPPEHGEKRRYYLRSFHGKHIIGDAEEQGSHGHLIIHHNDRQRVEVMYGCYCFLNRSGTPTSGNFLLIRKDIDPQPLLKKCQLFAVPAHVKQNTDLQLLLDDMKNNK